MNRCVGRPWAMWLGVLVGCQLVIASAARGQLPRGQQWQTLPLEERKGVIVEVGPGAMRVRLPKESASVWTVVPAPDARVEVTGVASREMLQPNQFILVSLNIDETGKVTDPVTQVTFPGTGVPEVAAPGLGAAGGKRLPGRRPAGTYNVSGLIKLVKDNTVTVQAGRDKFEFEVADDAQLVVNTPNLGLVGSGDDIELEGRFLQRLQLQATVLTVTLAKPVAPPPKKGARRPEKQPQ